MQAIHSVLSYVKIASLLQIHIIYAILFGGFRKLGPSWFEKYIYYCTDHIQITEHLLAPNSFTIISKLRCMQTS